MLKFLPPSSTPDTRRLLVGRGLRGFVDGMVGVLMISYLSDLGFSPGQIGLLVTATLLGSAALTITTGLFGGRFSQRHILLAACAVMFCTGLGLAGLTSFWPLFVVAVLGTLNPAGSDVSVFLPVEQAMIAGTVETRDRTALFARYGLTGIFSAAVGALAAGAPVAIARSQGWSLLDAERSGFVLYSLVALVVGFLYIGLSKDRGGSVRNGMALKESRSLVLRLAAIFSVDSFGSGFVANSILLLWLYGRFGISVETAGLIFFCSGLLSASSQLASPLIAKRIGLIRTMAYTHLPAQGLLILAVLMPTAELSIALLLVRMIFSAMDAPARQSYVMAMVPPEERAAASSVTNVPRSLVAAIGPGVAGWMLTHSTFGWPLILGASLKAGYNLLLLVQFRNVRPPEEQTAPAPVPAAR